MATVSLDDLQQRLTQVEAQLAQLLGRKSAEPGPEDWRSTLGMFTDDEVMQRIVDEAARYREEDRQAARTDPNYFADDEP